MGNSERHEPPTDAAIDGWFDLLDEPVRPSQNPPSMRPGAQGRQSHGNLAALNEISNKVTPVMLAPVHHLIPTIEPSHPSIEPRDVWETEGDDSIDSFFGVQPANSSSPHNDRKSDPEPLPPLMEMADADGEEFLDFGEAPIAPIGLATARLSTPEVPASARATVTGGRVAPLATAFANDLSDDPDLEFEARVSLVPPARRPTHVRPSQPPSDLLPDPTDIPASTPVPSTLLHPSKASVRPPPPPSPRPSELDDDGFDLSDFDRWGNDGDAVGASSPFTSGSEFTSPPSPADFSEALTIPRMSDGRPIAPHEAVRAVISPALKSVPAPSNTPTRPAPSAALWDTRASAAPTVTPSRRPTLIQNPHEAPTASPPPLLTPAPAPASTRPPPLPRAQSRRSSPSMPGSAPVPAPVPARRTPQQDMHERLDLGDFAGALSIAEGLLEVDPDDTDATHVMDVCRARLRALYVGRLGSLEQVPVMAMSPAEMRHLNLDHRAGFILSLIDGMSTLDDIIDISAMPQIEALRTLYTLCTQQVISLRKR